MENIALVVGATGITGSNLADELIAQGWTTYGLSRNPNNNIPNLCPIKADLMDEQNLTEAL
ncbi:NAD-dependent epimerase/dehydratase family protein, partial [Chryseobacterium sp.]|uniref:NAD-dependent epimerase/dehydratase family protein n=1 Tax=Chryseobacterium sp. TaxID=1871047 RepID=UPI0026087B46